MAKTNNLSAIRGMNDILPIDTAYWQILEQQLRDVLRSYGYQEIRFPILESTALFKRAIGEVTDIVEKEMYTFTDRNGDSLTLRPEGTACCVRAGIQNGLFNQSQKLWYMGAMFRHERPQKGRYRQFNQIGVEVYGLSDADIDAEILLMSARLWKNLGLSGLSLQINSLGSSEARLAYRQVLSEYYRAHLDSLDEDSKRRLDSNPLRILDSKNPDMQALNQNAPLLLDHLDTESKIHFEQLTALLDNAGLDYEINPRLVRGLDYYNRTVFEWVTDQLGAQGTVCAGGRYDSLVEQIGGKATPAIGFACGMERLLALLQTQNSIKPIDVRPRIYLISMGDIAAKAALALSEQLRDALPGLALMSHMGGGSFKSQFKKADKSGAEFALILGEDEVNNKQITLKFLRSEQTQQSLAQIDLIPTLKSLLG